MSNSQTPPIDGHDKNSFGGAKTIPYWRRVGRYLLAVIDARLLGNEGNMESSVSIMRGESTECLYRVKDNLAEAFKMLETEVEIENFLVIANTNYAIRKRGGP